MKLFASRRLLPAKTLRQPWAGLVLLGLKSIETSETRTSLRGDFVVCAGLGVDREALARLRDELVPSAVSAEEFDRATGLRGVALALVRITGCRRLRVTDRPRSRWWSPSEPRWAWLLEDRRLLQPFPVRGMPGFFGISRRRVNAALRTFTSRC